MKKNDNYISGPHHYWAHFAGGLVCGALLGWWTWWEYFDSLAVAISLTAVTAVGLALCCGRWGDVAWQRMSDWLVQYWNILWRRR